MRKKQNNIEELLKQAFETGETISPEVRSCLDETYDRIRTINRPLGAPRSAAGKYRIYCVRILIAAVILFVLGVGTVSAFVRLSGAGLVTEGNEKAVSQPEIAYAVTEIPGDAEMEPAEEEYADNPILSKEALLAADPDGLLKGAEIANIKVTEGDGFWEIPKSYFHNGDMVILTKNEDEGWSLKKGQGLRLQLVFTEGSGKSGEGSHVLIGTIKNGICEELFLDTKGSYDISVTAEEDGIYYFYIRNSSAGRLVFQGKIELENN